MVAVAEGSAALVLASVTSSRAALTRRTCRSGHFMMCLPPCAENRGPAEPVHLITQTIRQSARHGKPATALQVPRLWPGGARLRFGRSRIVLRRAYRIDAGRRTN